MISVNKDSHNKIDSKTYTVAETEYKIGEIPYEELLAAANDRILSHRRFQQVQAAVTVIVERVTRRDASRHGQHSRTRQGGDQTYLELSFHGLGSFQS